MSTFPYQVGLLGAVASIGDSLAKTLLTRIADLGLAPDDIRILAGKDVAKRDPKAPFAAIFFGYQGATLSTEPELAAALSDSSVILPVVPNLKEFSKFVPEELRHINGLALSGDDPSLERVASFLLETFRLLRSERRLFISYKRTDCALIAAQLYDELDKRGFDVFIDTRAVPPGKDFQAILWHRLADSDVVVMLDTPNFFESRWTEEEVARANSTNVQILQVLWPDRDPVPAASLSSFLKLEDLDFASSEKVGDSAKLLDVTLRRIAIVAEELRARALAARHRYLINAFCDQAKDLGLTPELQPTRHIVFQGKKSPVLVIPLVGVPNALRLHEVHKEVVSRKPPEIWVLYDERGLLIEAISHVEWLNDSLPLKALRVLDVVDRLQQERAP